MLPNLIFSSTNKMSKKIKVLMCLSSNEKRKRFEGKDSEHPKIERIEINSKQNESSLKRSKRLVKDKEIAIIQ